MTDGQTCPRCRGSYFDDGHLPQVCPHCGAGGELVSAVILDGRPERGEGEDERVFTIRLARWLEQAGLACGEKLECGGSCWLEQGHAPPCLCIGDDDGPGSCPA